MREYSPALVLVVVVTSIVLGLTACLPLREQTIEVTRVVTKDREVTREVTREVEVEVTREVTREVQKEPDPAHILLWTSEDESDGGLRFVQSLADQYVSLRPFVTLEITRKDVHTLREDLLVAAGSTDSGPDVLWTTNDHVSAFVEAELILPVDDMIDPREYAHAALEAIQVHDQTWGVPISTGNHLMLVYNKDLLPAPPQGSDEMTTTGRELTTDDRYGLVYDQTDPLWLVPWLGGFGGSVFAEDGRTPALDTPEMVATLRFLQGLVYESAIVPPGSNYDGAYVMFNTGKAAMTINGSWALEDYRETLGDKLGIARLPRVSSTGEWPHPYATGTYLMFSSDLQRDQSKLEAALDFARFAISANNQVLLAAKLHRLPALKAAVDDPFIANHPILRGSADQMEVGTPMPTVTEMQCNWDAMRLEMEAVLIDGKSPEEAAEDMQSMAVSCVEELN